MFRRKSRILPTISRRSSGDTVGSSRAAIRPIATDHIPTDFPSGLVTPKQVVFRSADGLTIHGQLFEAAGGGSSRKPAVVYVHGGPPRQMLLGWHYSDYYSNAYALNQYLASRGFIVLSVNYRLGIGYGYDFHQPPNSGARGAAEYRDIQAAAAYLRALPRVDANRVGIYGGSYGGYLTALALAPDGLATARRARRLSPRSSSRAMAELPGNPTRDCSTMSTSRSGNQAGADSACTRLSSIPKTHGGWLSQCRRVESTARTTAAERGRWAIEARP